MILHCCFLWVFIIKMSRGKRRKVQNSSLLDLTRSKATVENTPCSRGLTEKNGRSSSWFLLHFATVGNADLLCSLAGWRAEWFDLLHCLHAFHYFTEDHLKNNTYRSWLQNAWWDLHVCHRAKESLLSWWRIENLREQNEVRMLTEKEKCLTISILAGIGHWEKSWFGMFHLKAISHITVVYPIRKCLLFIGEFVTINARRDRWRSSVTKDILPVTTRSIARRERLRLHAEGFHWLTVVRNHHLATWTSEWLDGKSSSCIHSLSLRCITVGSSLERSLLVNRGWSFSFSLFTSCLRHNVIVELRGQCQWSEPFDSFIRLLERWFVLMIYLRRSHH